MEELFPELTRPGSRLAVRIDAGAWTYTELAGAVCQHVATLGRAGAQQGDRIAVWAAPSLSTVAALVGNMAAGCVSVLLSPKLGSNELAHIVNDARPGLAFADSAFQTPALSRPQELDELPGVRSDEDDGSLATLRERYVPTGGSPAPIQIDASPALILYTSGTTGPPKGAVISRKNIAANLDALARAWGWTDRDTVVHSLPLVHVHGLVLGLFGSLRRGGALHHLSRFTAEGIAVALADQSHEQTVLFAVPTMYRRLADAAEQDDRLARALQQPRLLVSGSAALPVQEHARIRRLAGRGVHERYGLTETLINCAVPAASPPTPGYVGPPLSGVKLALVDESRQPLESCDDDTIGEIAVRSASVFQGYLNQPDATAESYGADGWFYTGDLATRNRDGWIRILGRRSTDLIKTGGYRVGAGEVEDCLLEHPSVSEVAVVGVPDDDLGQRIVAFVVPREAHKSVRPSALIDFVTDRLSTQKRPREVRVVEDLPRNIMGKIQKALLLESE